MLRRPSLAALAFAALFAVGLAPLAWVSSGAWREARGALQRERLQLERTAGAAARALGERIDEHLRQLDRVAGAAGTGAAGAAQARALLDSFATHPDVGSAEIAAVGAGEARVTVAVGERGEPLAALAAAAAGSGARARIRLAGLETLARRLAPEGVEVALTDIRGRVVWRSATSPGSAEALTVIGARDRGDVWRVRLRATPAAAGALDAARTSAMAGAALLVALAALCAWLVHRGVSRPIRRFAGLTRAIGSGDYAGRSGAEGLGREVSGLGLELDRLGLAIGSQLGRLRRARHDSEELVSSSRRLIEATFHAKEPRVAAPAQLVGAYSRAAARNLGAEPWVADGIAEALVEGVEAEDAEVVAPRRDFRQAAEGLRLVAPVEARIVDVADSGLGIESLASLNVGARHEFRLRFDGQELRIPGQVVWCRLERHLQSRGQRLAVYRAGLRFAKPGSRAVRRLLEIAAR